MTSDPRAEFGPNGQEVRRFLADIRTLDWDRAIQIWDGRTAAGADGYDRALARASAVGRARREADWLVARDTASTIAKDTLGESELTNQVAGVLADVAGAIVVRDLLLPLDYQLLVRPWTPRGETVAAAAAGPEAWTPVAAGALPALSAASVDGARSGPPAGLPAPGLPAPGLPAAALPAAGAPNTATSPWAATRGLPRPGRAARRRSLVLVTAPVIVAVMALTALASGIGVLFAPSSAPIVAQASEQPTVTQPAVAVASPGPGTFVPASFGPIETEIPSALPEPSVLAGPSEEPSAEPTLDAEPTPRPAEPTERPDRPTPKPPPTPAPTPVPTPVVTPPPEPTEAPPTPRMCRVIDLVGVRTYWAEFLWYVAGFRGEVTFDPEPPPSYRIETQSLQPGTFEPCSSGITVGT